MYGHRFLDDILGLEYRARGYELTENDHVVYLLFKDQLIATFSATGATIQSIRNEADKHWNQINSGIEFARA